MDIAITTKEMLINDFCIRIYFLRIVSVSSASLWSCVINSSILENFSSGRVRFYQSVVGGILLAIVPVSYVVLRLGAAPWSVFLIHFCVCTVAFFVRLFIIRSMIHLSLYSYFHAVLLRCLYVLLLAMPLPIGLLYIFPATLWAGISVCFVSQSRYKGL